MINTVLRVIGNILSKTYKKKDSHYDDIHYIGFFLWQKLFFVNSKVPWPVHFTSCVIAPDNIKIGDNCSPGSNKGQYIQGINGIEMADNVWMGPGSKIISANHDPNNYKKHLHSEAIKIGSNVWIGADAIILAGVTIGDNVIIGAGSIVTKDIPPDVIAAGNPCRVIKGKDKYSGNK